MTFGFEEYEDVKVVAKTPELYFYKVKQASDRISYILKCISSEYPKPKQVAKLNHEFLILKKLEHSGSVIKVFDIKEMKNTYGLLLEDTGLNNLADYLKSTRIDLERFLDIAIVTSEAIHKLHSNDVIHRNIKPESILYDAEKNQVKLIDFELASELSHDYQPSKIIASLEGTLSYISPEQTGRMNRAVTASSDLYSLGVVFYQMITGQLPFEEIEPASLVYAHIAKLPIPPNQINKGIPQAVSDIIMKLLSKKAEDRYKTAFGLREDLIRCSDEYKLSKYIHPFKLGENDFSQKFEIPDKLYGRDNEIEYVLSTFDNMTTENSSKLLLVYGYSGIGKTSLINEVHKPILQKNGVFIDGKIDQYHRDQPYFSLTQAFNKLVEMWLSEPKEILDVWIERINFELGDVVQVIIELIPLLGTLIPNPPKLAELNPLEAKNRLQLTLLKFIKILTDKAPLVLFIDDAQWASSTLLDLLEYVVSREEIKNLMLVIGFRDNEVLAGHPLLNCIENIEKIKVANKIKLKPLDKIFVNQMIQDTLNYTEQEAKELTEIVYSKTEGNPFFLKEVLEDLYAKNLLTFSLEKKVWQYDPKAIFEQVNISTNVVDFMIKRLEGFSTEIQEVLNIAACVGNIFSLEDLASVLKADKSKVAQSLWSIVKEGMILPVAGDYEYSHELGKKGNMPLSNVVYKFQHDRIQQASYQLGSNEKNSENHYRIGKALVAKYDNQTEAHALEIASQLNKALELVRDKDEQLALMYLNYYAGENMLASSAYAAAIEYFTVATSLLPQGHWDSLYEFTCKLFKSLAKALFSKTEFEKAEELMEALINHAKTFIERMTIINLKAVLYSTVGKRNISISLAIKGLNEMGVSISENPSKYSILLTQLQIKWYLGMRKIPSLVNDPEVTDPAKVLIAEFLYLVTQDAMFIGNPALLALSNMKLVLFSIKYGNFRSTTIAYVMYAGAILGATEDSRQFADLAIAVLEKLNAVEHKCKTYHWYAMFCLTFHTWWGKKRDSYMKSIKYGLETGDIRYLAYAIDHTTPFDPSFTISEAIEFDKQYEITLKETGYREIMCLRKTYNQYLLSLCGRTKDRLSMSDDRFDELENEKEMNQLYFYLGPTLYHLMKAMLAFLYDEYPLALEEMGKIQENVINAYYGCPDFMMYSVYKFLINAALYETFDITGKKHVLEVMLGELSRMKKLAKHCPDNYIFHYFAMQAELARIKNKPSGEVLDLYDQAIEFAKKYKFLNFIAIYSERAAKFLLGMNKHTHASSYLQAARYSYERWGATEKVKYLDEKYADLLSFVTVSQRNKQEIALDYTTILKLTKYLFEETNTERLIEKILKILAENIGSQYCVLMLKQKSEFIIEGIFDEMENRLEVLTSRDITEDDLPANLVNFVVRTGNDIVIDDITKHAEYSQFPYVKSHPVKSIICVPIISHKDLVGIFYGEHRDIAGAFTNERAELLRVLSGVIAISLENSRYVDHMVRIYKKTECFVPKAFLEILKKENVEEVALGDCVKKEITVLFNDIRSFTTLVEKRTPETAFAFVNRYWKFIAPIIRKHRGYIDQFQGDGLMAIFPEHPSDAVQASVAMMDALAEFNASQVELQDEPVRMGIGISTGPAMLGVIGEEDRHVPGLISDVANTSSRVEGLNKVYGSRILLSGPTVHALGSIPNFVLRKLDSVLLKGKTISTEVYEVIEWAGKLKEMSLEGYLELYAMALQDYFDGNFAAAKSNFQRCLAYYPEDKAVLVLLDRCSLFIEQGTPKDWNGTFTMTSK